MLAFIIISVALYLFGIVLAYNNKTKAGTCFMLINPIGLIVFAIAGRYNRNLLYAVITYYECIATV